MRIYYLLTILVAATVVQQARAHDWYPHECCHDRDCVVAVSLEKLPDGSMRVETATATAVVPRHFAVRVSPDQHVHACLRKNGTDNEHHGWTVICLFLPGLM